MMKPSRTQIDWFKIIKVLKSNTSWNLVPGYIFLHRLKFEFWPLWTSSGRMAAAADNCSSSQMN